MRRYISRWTKKSISSLVSNGRKAVRLPEVVPTIKASELPAESRVFVRQVPTSPMK